ncbi:MAG: DUF4625 domain-containing protein [Bacteroidales bacterium]|nr:DUF4625 domain-containing protein [Bacteroidales bacterium]
MKNTIHLEMFLIPVFILQLCLLTSCKKETDNQHPVITYISPYELQEFTVLDNIPVIADISDDNIIENVKVDLVNNVFYPILPAIFLYPKTASYHLDIEYPIDDVYLESGDYYIHIRAEDGTNNKNQYQLIWINGIPRQLEKVIVLTQSNFNEIKVSEIDKSDNFNSLFDINGDYSGSGTNSRYQQLYITGKDLINLTTFDLLSLELDWLKETFPPVPMHNDDCLYFDEKLYVSFHTNYIYGYRYNGSQMFNTSVENDKTPSRLAKFNEFLLVDLQSKTGGITYLATFYLATGAEKQRLATNYKIVDFFEIDNNNVLIAGNSLGEGVLKLYDPYLNIETHLLPVPGKIVCIEKLTDNNFIIGTDNMMLIYDHDQSILTSILPGKVAYRIRFDETENNIYTVAPKQIEKIKYPQMLFQKSYPIPDSIFNIHLLYNK